jgi:hypothetical protein
VRAGNARTWHTARPLEAVSVVIGLGAQERCGQGEGPQAPGTQGPMTPTGRVQLSLVPVQGGGGKGKRAEPVSREPSAMQVARPVVCPAKAGVFSRRETYQGKSQSPVARRAGGRETNLLKPLDSLICGMGASLQAVAQANAQVAP